MVCNVYLAWLICFLKFELIYCSRGIAPGVLDADLFHIQTLQHLMEMTRTWDSTMSMIPKGGDTIWGGLNWSPEEDYVPRKSKWSMINVTKEFIYSAHQYGRIISFGKDMLEADSSNIHRTDFRV